MGLQYEQRENMNGLEDLNTQLVNLKTNNQKNEDLIHHLLLKKEQDKQKAKEYKHIYNQLIIDRSELEEILVSCIQEIKKDIIKRKQLDKNFNQKLKQNLELISLENFQATDKKKLLLTFMSDDKILESLYYLTFGVKEDEQNNKLSKNWRFSVADANKKYKQFKKTVDKMNLSKQNEKCQIDALSVEKQALEASYRPRRPKILQIRSNKSDIQYILMSESLRKSLLNPKDNEDEDYQMTDLANSKIFSNKMRSQTERPEFMSNIKKIDTSQIDRNITANLFQQELSVYSINNNFIQNNETLYNNLIDQNMRKNSHVRNDLSDYQIDENISGELNSRNISLNSQMQSPNPNNCISSQQLGSISSIDLKIAQKQQEKPQKTLNKQHKVKQLNKPMKKIQLHSYDLSNKIWQQSKEHGLYRVLFIFLLYLVPICRKIYMFKFKTFQTYIESVWILHINDQWKNFKNHAVTTEEQKLQSLIEYYILILIFTELIFKLLQFKILFQHRHKKWSNERVSHKLNRFDRFLFTNERIEMYFTTCLNDMTLNMNQYRKRVCASNKNPLFKPIMLRILVIVLPFEISIIPYLLDLSNNSKKCQYIQKVLILYSFIYRSCEYPFQISMIYKSSMRCIESEFLFNSFFSIILINGFDLACFIGVTLYLYLSRDFLVNRKSIKNALIT